MIHLIVIQASLCIYLDAEADPSSVSHTTAAPHTYPNPWPEAEFVLLSCRRKLSLFFFQIVCPRLCVCVHFLNFGDFKQTSFVSTPPACVSSVCQFQLL